MKNRRRGAIALLMTMLLILTTIGMSASVLASDQNEPSAASVVKRTEATIDANERGSITVTKYKSYNSALTGSNATGMNDQLNDRHKNTTSTANISDNDYTLLNNAEFRLYPVATAQQTMDYYNGTTQTKYDAEFFYKTNRATSNGQALAADYSNIQVYNASNAVVPAAEIKSGKTGTDGDGILKFTNLPVGMYLLVEVKGADQIASLSEPALISIPMVNAAYETNGSSNNENQKWQYDVFVYPKNKTAEAKVELTKVASDGRTVIPNVSFKLEKWTGSQDPSADAIKGTTSWELVLFTNDVDDKGDAQGQKVNTSAFDASAFITTDANGTITINDLPGGLNGTTYRLVEQSAPDGYIMDQDPIVFKVTKDNTIEFKETVDGDLVNGVPTAGHRLTAKTYKEKDNGASELKLTMRNENPSIVKTVKKNQHGGNGEEWVDETDYNIGTEVEYRIEMDVPYNVGELKTYQIEDIPCVGLTDRKPTAIKYGTNFADSVANIAANTGISEVSATDQQGQGFKIDFTANDALKGLAGQRIRIEYKALLNTKATPATEATTKGNDNMVTLTFDQSKGITNADGTASASVFKINDSAIVNTYQIDITKKADSENGTGLDGVQFKLFQYRDNKAAATEVPMLNGSNGIYHHAAAAETPETNIVTEAAGKLIFNGLEKGNYYLKEIKTKDGYNLLSDTIDFKITDKDDATAQEGSAQPKVTKWNEMTAYEAAAEGSTDKVLNQQVFESAEHSDDVNNGKFHPTKTVINKKGFTLPQTGTVGYFAIYAIGAILILGGLLLMFGGRKKKIR